MLFCVSFIDLNVLVGVIRFILRQLWFVEKVKPMNTNGRYISISIFLSFHFLIRFPDISAVRHRVPSASSQTWTSCNCGRGRTQNRMEVLHNTISFSLGSWKDLLVQTVINAELFLWLGKLHFKQEAICFAVPPCLNLLLWPNLSCPLLPAFYLFLFQITWVFPPISGTSTSDPKLSSD